MKIVWPTTCVFTTFFDMFSSNLICSSFNFHHIMIFRPQLVLFYGVIHIVRMHKIEDPPPPLPQYTFCIGKMVLFIRSVRFGDTLVRTYYVNGPYLGLFTSGLNLWKILVFHLMYLHETLAHNLCVSVMISFLQFKMQFFYSLSGLPIIIFVPTICISIFAYLLPKTIWEILDIGIQFNILWR